MASDKTIFMLRFGSDETLYPAPSELRAFLESPKKKGLQGRHDDDLSAYRELLERVAVFERDQQQGDLPQNFRERMFYGVLGLSQFVHPALKRQVELFKYHAHGFAMLDFKKPMAFIKAAKEEMARLDPKRKKDAAKRNRLQSMVEERKRTLEALEKRRAALANELGGIARYVRSNLVKIGRLCEASIVILMELQLAGKMEGRLIDDIRADFREHLHDDLDQGQMAGKYHEIVRQDIDLLTREMSVLIREDVYALAGLYEAIYDHTKRTVHELDILMAEMETGRGRSFDEDCELFMQIEQALVSLMSGHHFELKAKVVRSVTAHERILREKRYRMIENVFSLLGSERRVMTARRSDDTRRTFDEPAGGAFERRQRTDRRGRDRRAPVSSGVYC